MGFCLYLIKLTQQKDAYLISTRKCCTIAIKTIQLSSHITQHDVFINTTFSSKIFFETNNTFAIRGKIPFPFHYVREDKKLNRVKLPYVIDLIHDVHHVGFAIIMQISYTLLRGQTTQVREVITNTSATQMICFTFIECLSPK